ncbi:MAG: integrase core domain-containing protein [Anaerolineales bacterium]
MHDRLKLLFIARFLPHWKSLLRIDQPETLLRWHHDLFKHFWKKKSGTKHHPRKISEETIALIRKMAEANRLWGAERIRGELLKLGIKIAKRTIQKYLPKDRRSSGQTWATFLKNHAEDIFVCDFTVVHDLCFRPISLLIVMHLATRQIKHFNLTRNPSDAWMAQQMREINAWDKGPRFLICDNDAVFGDTFEETAKRMGTEVVHTPFYTPQANGHCERFVGSVRHECLDHMLIFHERQLRRVMKEYTQYYNTARPHQGLRQKIPIQFKDGATIVQNVGKGQPLFVTPFLNGLHHSYSWTAPQN